jgi:hypothetical protein
MPEMQPGKARSFIVGADQPLIGVLDEEDGREVVRYFTDEATADEAFGQDSVKRALGLAGAWSDLDWDEMESALDRIRHESKPTPPIDEL